ncbi:hypothetical protein NDU88_000204, partial [Pleurodeles waltl]
MLQRSIGLMSDYHPGMSGRKRRDVGGALFKSFTVWARSTSWIWPVVFGMCISFWNYDTRGSCNGSRIRGGSPRH